MTDIYKAVGGGWFPTTEAGREFYEKNKHKEISFKKIEQRNKPWADKYFKMIGLAFKNQERHKTSDQLRAYCLSKAGHGIYMRIDEHTRELCKLLCEQKEGYYEADEEGYYWFFRGNSMAHDSMTQEVFEDVYEKTLIVLRTDFGFDEEFMRELDSFG